MAAASIDDLLAGLTPYAASRLQEATSVLHEIRRRREMRLAALSGTVDDDDDRPIINELEPPPSDDEHSREPTPIRDPAAPPSPPRGAAASRHPASYPAHPDPPSPSPDATRAVTIAHEAGTDVGSRLYLEGLRMRERVARRVAVCRATLEEGELSQLTLRPRVTMRAHRKAPKGSNYYKVNMQWRQRVDAEIEKVRKMHRLSELRVVTAQPALCAQSLRIVEGDEPADADDLPRRIGGKGRRLPSTRRKLGRRGRVYAGPVSGWRTHFERFQARRLGLLDPSGGGFVLNGADPPAVPSINLRSLRMKPAGPVGERLYHDAATRENRRLHLRSVYDALESVDPHTKQPLFSPATNENGGIEGGRPLAAQPADTMVAASSTIGGVASMRGSLREREDRTDVAAAVAAADRGGAAAPPVRRRTPAEWSEYLARTHPAEAAARQEERAERLLGERSAATPFRPKINANSAALAARARTAGRAPVSVADPQAPRTAAGGAPAGTPVPQRPRSSVASTAPDAADSLQRSTARSARGGDVPATPPPKKVATRDSLNTFLQRNNMLVLSRFRHQSNGLVQKSASEGAQCTFAPQLNEQSLRLVNSARPVAVPLSILDDAGLSPSGDIASRPIPRGVRVAQAAAASGGGGGGSRIGAPQAPLAASYAYHAPGTVAYPAASYNGAGVGVHVGGGGTARSADGVGRSGRSAAGMMGMVRGGGGGDGGWWTGD